MKVVFQKPEPAISLLDVALRPSCAMQVGPLALIEQQAQGYVRIVRRDAEGKPTVRLTPAGAEILLRSGETRKKILADFRDGGPLDPNKKPINDALVAMGWAFISPGVDATRPSLVFRSTMPQVKL